MDSKGKDLLEWVLLNLVVSLFLVALHLIFAGVEGLMQFGIIISGFFVIGTMGFLLGWERGFRSAIFEKKFMEEMIDKISGLSKNIINDHQLFSILGTDPQKKKGIRIVSVEPIPGEGDENK